tara:strand:+ start:5838 stop:6029 length:192 start_codon:yes stop_codon:yes gene_type:complete
MMEDQEYCELCLKSGCVHRIPQMPSVKIVKEKTGALVREYIEDSQRDLREEKKRLKKEEYNPK